MAGMESNRLVSEEHAWLKAAGFKPYMYNGVKYDCLGTITFLYDLGVLDVERMLAHGKIRRVEC